MENEVLAVVAGEEITNAELDEFLKNAPKEQQAYTQNPEYREHFAEQLIALHLFTKMAEDEKLDQTDEFAKILLGARRDILAQMAMAEVLKDITVEDFEVKAFYQANAHRFQKPATVSAKHILCKTEEEINKVKELLEKEEKTFEDAAKEFSTCPSKERGGDLGEFGRGQMVKEFEDAAFDAEIGAVAGPVKTQFGYHLIKVEKKNEPSMIEYDEVAETIRQNLVQQKQAGAYDQKVKELKEKYMEEPQK